MSHERGPTSGLGTSLRELRTGRRRLDAGVRRVSRAGRVFAGSTIARRLPSGVLFVLVAAAGGWLGLLAGGTTTSSLGPVQTQLTVRPSLTGSSVLEIPPLGSLTLDTHDAPLQLRAEVSRVDAQKAQSYLANPGQLRSLQADVVHDARAGAERAVLQASASMIVGSALAVLVVLRRPRRAVLAGALMFAVIAASGVAAALTWDPRSITRPRYEGLLTIAPSVVGNAEDLVGNFGRYSEQLAKVVGNVSRLYDVTATLPTYAPDPSTVRVLFVSDIHLNPAAFSVMKSVAQQFRTDFVIDAGDLTDHGSRAEERFTRLISGMRQPYVFVRGNHDSRAIQQAVARQPHAIVLDNGATADVGGLRITGTGDPRFTPDKDTGTLQTSAQIAAHAEGFLEAIRTESAAGTPVDIAVVHDLTTVPEIDGNVPLVLSGHGHRRDVRMLAHGTRSFEQGSTGGAGLRGLEHERATPVELSVLYLSRTTGRLQAWDDVTVGGLGSSSAEIERHIADDVASVAGKPATEAARGDSPNRQRKDGNRPRTP